MKIAVAADHAGYELKDRLSVHLVSLGHEVADFGTAGPESVDYPSYAGPAAESVADGTAEMGVFVCGSGVGVCIVANKVPGVRAVNAHSAEEAAMSRLHNNANVITLGARRVSPTDAAEIVETFISTQFEGGRHERRVELISEIERDHEPRPA